MLAKHETLEEAVDEICAAMTKKKEDLVRADREVETRAPTVNFKFTARTTCF